MHAPAYSGRDWWIAVCQAGVFGWCGVVLPPLLQSALSAGGLSSGFGTLYLWALFGIPLAIVISVIVIGPVVRWLFRSQISVLRAGVSGCIVSSLLTVLYGWRQAQRRIAISEDPNIHSQVGGGDYIRSVDGVLTPYGWQVLIGYNIAFVTICTLGASVMQRRIAGRYQGGVAP